MNRKPQSEADEEASKETEGTAPKTAAPPTPQQVNEAVDEHRAAVPGHGPRSKGKQ